MACLTWDFLNNKTIGIWGLGKEGLAAQKALAHFAPNAKLLPFDDNGIDCLEKCDVVVLSPGVSIYRDEVKNARQKGVLLTSGTNLFLDNKPQNTSVIAVTGTKGKSTTASLIYQLVRQKDPQCALGGNIGKPLLDFLFVESKIIIAELSSYQCASLTKGVDAALLLNLYPEHLQWHQTHQNYYADKLNLIQLSAKKVINGQNEEILQHLNTIKDPLFFNTAQTWHIEDGFFYRGNEKRFETNALALKGAHNALNACGALSVVEAFGLQLSNEDILTAFAAIAPLPHRLQPIGDYQGICFVDDSISTTPQSTIAALKTYENKPFITLIAGGFDRGQEYAPLIDYAQTIKGKIHIIALPDTGLRLYEAAQQAHLNSTYAHNMAEAVQKAFATTPKGGVVLLSPAAPSYNCYKNFEERGTHFATCAKELSTTLTLPLVRKS